jgi:hypothetical protein
MTNGKEYLLAVNAIPGITPQAGSMATIFDWGAGGSFTCIVVLYTGSTFTPSFHVRATATNGYGAANFANSKIRYRDANNTLESRDVTNFTPL